MRGIRVPNGIGGLDNLCIGFIKQLSGDLEARLLLGSLALRDGDGAAAAKEYGRARDLGAPVTAVDSLLPDYGGNLFNLAGYEDRVRINIADVRGHGMEYLVQGQEVLFNLAGQVSHIDSMTDPLTDLEINCRAQLSILEACRRANPEIRIVYDTDYLYIAVWCFDSDPSGVRATQMKRDGDFGFDDVISISLDPYDTRRNGFLFEVNPVGAKRDALIENNRNFRRDWNGICISPGRVGRSSSASTPIRKWT